MGLFTFFNLRKNHSNGLDMANGLNGHDVSEDVFIEKNANGKSANSVEKPAMLNIDYLYEFLNRNHESQGYEDALANPDTLYMEQNVQGLKTALELTIRQVKTHYEKFLNQVDFHIASRSRSGMVDTVDELKMKKDIALNHIEIVHQIEEEARQNQGACQGIVLSYTRGFRRGMAAISHHEILKTKL